MFASLFYSLLFHCYTFLLFKIPSLSHPFVRMLNQMAVICTFLPLHWQPLSHFLLLLGGLSHGVAAQGSSANGTDQIANFCRRFDHRTAIVDNRLFVDGGIVNIYSSERQGDALATNQTSTFVRCNILLLKET